MQKKYKPKWYHWIPFILAWVLLLPFALLAVPYMWYVSTPIQRAIDEQPQYWQNWKQIKLKSRRSTMQVLSMLLGECSHRGELDCQFRSEEDVLRLEKFLSRKRPCTSKPRSIDDVIFLSTAEGGVVGDTNCATLSFRYGFQCLRTQKPDYQVGLFSW